MNIHPAFYPVIGQSRIKQMLTASARAVNYDKELLNCLFEGEAGLGKTRVMRAYADALKEENPDMEILWYDSPNEFRLLGPEWDKIMKTLTEGKPFALFIDEAHELVTDDTKQHNIMLTFIRKVLDGNNRGKTVQINDELVVHFNRKESVICMGTNFPHKLDKSGAIQSRFTSMKLDNYETPDLKKIVELMAEDRNIAFDTSNGQNPIERIARCGRGTARFVERIFEQLQLLPNNRDITEKNVMNALQMLKMYPRGLNQVEINLLRNCATHPVKAAQFIAFENIERSSLQKSVAYLSNNEVGFLTVNGNGSMSTTKLGVAFLAQCEKLGFKGAAL